MAAPDKHAGGSGYGRGGGGGGKPLTPEDIQAINYYTGDDGYRVMNMRTRGVVPSQLSLQIMGIPQKALKTVDRDIAALDQALEKLPGYTGTVYRGMSLTSGELKVFVNTTKTDSVLSLKGFTSTSQAKEEARQGNVEFIIKAKGKQGKEISQYSKFGREREVLFTRNSSFRVIKLSPTFKSQKGGKQRLISAIYELEEI